MSKMIGQRETGTFEAEFKRMLQTSLPDHQLLSAEPLTGGLSNRCWRVTLQHTPTLHQSIMVWRPHSASTEAFGLSRQHECQLLNTFSTHISCSLAPNAIAMIEQGLLVEWVNGKTADEHFSIDTLLQLQARIHTLPTPEWRLDCRARAAHYWQGISDSVKDATLCAIYRAFQEREPILWFDDTCCHHDLGWYNIIQPHSSLVGGNTAEPNGEPTRVIDWEYAAAGDPSLDLAFTIIANGLNRERAVSLYCQYAGVTTTSGIERWHQAVDAWIPWCDYLAMLWFYVGAQLWSDPGYLEQANKYKEQLCCFLQSSLQRSEEALRKK